MSKAIIRIVLAILFVTAFSSSAYAAVKKFYVEPTQFNAAFQIMDRGMSNIIGLFQAATAAFDYDAETQTISKVRLAIDTTSMMIPNQNASDEFGTMLDARDYPELSFMATAAQQLKNGAGDIKGTLTFHGQKKEATFHAVVNNATTSKVGLSLRGSFKRADFGMGDEPEMPGRFGDTITLMLEMQAIKP